MQPTEDLKADYLEGMEDAKTPAERRHVKMCPALQTAVQLFGCIKTGVTIRLTAIVLVAWKFLSS